MCGIAGIFLLQPDQIPREALRKMVQAIAHRGPDAEGYFDGRQASLGHRRLSIIDLSDAASQPMKDESQRYALVFSGEIYNYRALRRSIRNPFFSNSDTEVILRLFQQHREQTWPLLNGMFAIAMLDNATNELFLARDHAGIKPLYYYHDSKQFIFASELSALLASGLIPAKYNYEALSLYLQLGYFPAPFTPYMGISKLPAGYSMRVSSAGVELNRYWEPHYSNQERRTSSQKDLEQLLLQAIEHQMISDVPLGAFLSGGIDSSLIVALMSRISAQRVQTFTAGFSNLGYYDERASARTAAKHFKTDHHEFAVEEHLEELLPEVARVAGEPFADSSAVPTLCLARLTAKHVKVVLSGTGGDEVFGGYRKYMAAHWAAAYHALPRSVRSTIRKTVRLLPASRQSIWKERALLLQRFSDLSPHIPPNLQLNAVFSFEETQNLVGANLLDVESLFQASEGTIAENMMRFDYEFYLPEDLLVKEDRCTMAFGLEARVPYLDRTIVEFMQQLPIQDKVSGVATKKLFRKVAAKYLPAWILRRPKHGFGSPAAEWLRKELREMGERAVLQSQFFPENPLLRKKWDEHQKGKRDHSRALWAILMLELWRRGGL